MSSSDEPGQPPRISISRTSTNNSDPGAVRRGTFPLPDDPAPRPRVDIRRATDTQTLHPHKKHGGHSHEQWQYAAKTRSWKHSGDELKWRIKWSREGFPNGRVLIIDYLSTQHSEQASTSGGKRRLVAFQEFEHLEALEKFYADPLCKQAALRVIHVQNASWATGFLLRKFNIDYQNELVGMEGFSKWARYETPRQRNGKPFPNGKSWRAQVDPWRGVVRSAFGLDYLKPYKSEAPRQRSKRTRPLNAQVMHLNAHDDGSSPDGYDISVQRMSVYVQRNIGPPGDVSPEDSFKNPYHKHADANGSARFGNDGTSQSHQDEHGWKGKTHYDRDDGCIDVDDLDNTSAIIIFESSASLLLDDCLVQPRNDFENRWRRLFFSLKREVVQDDSHLASHCSNVILGDIFHGLAIVWQFFLNAASDHVSILEDKIYENPDDESRAPELWTNSSAWLKVDKIMYIHQDLVREMQSHLRDMEEEDPSEVQEDWLASTTSEYERLAHSVKEDLINPTANLNDLMYKSVGIRDSRQSLQLGLSMWRLSWITFIFLPLTFIVGFFGMNVSTFEHFPSIGWYFLAAVILLLLVLFLWYFIKHSLERRRQTAYQRGTYEQLFDELEEGYPTVWSIRGALDGVEPVGFRNRLKWRTLRRWFSPERTVDRQIYHSIEEDAGLGTWTRFKWHLLKRWIPEIAASRPNDGSELVGINADARPAVDDLGTIHELAKMSTPVMVAEGEPSAVQPLVTYGLRPMSRNSQYRRTTTEVRPGSVGSGGVTIEERNLSDSESDVGEGASDGRLSSHDADRNA